jgi:hypothetical protein
MAGKEINVKKILMNVQAIHVSMMGNALMRLDTLCASVRANGKVNCAIQIQPVNQIPAMEMATVLVLETLIHVIVGMAGLVQCVRQMLMNVDRLYAEIRVSVSTSWEVIYVNALQDSQERTVRQLVKH